MAKYRDQFELNTRDIEIIEMAVRAMIARQQRAGESDGKVSNVEELNKLLAKLHHQKVFYAQVNATGVPAG